MGRGVEEVNPAPSKQNNIQTKMLSGQLLRSANFIEHLLCEGHGIG